MKQFYFLLFACMSFSSTNAQIVNILDTNLETALLNYNCADINGDGLVDDDADLNDDGYIQVSEAESIFSLRFDFVNNIVDLTGLEYFINLENLWLSGNQITNLDLTSYPELKVFECVDCNLLNIDVTQNLQLEKLVCTNNQITDLNLSNNQQLNFLQCNNNELSNLNLNNNLALDELICSYNNLTNLNLTNSVNLERLFCGNNELSDLILPNGSELNYLDCKNNQLANIDVTPYPNLQSLEISNNLLTSLNLSNSINITQLQAQGNNLLSLSIKNGVFDYFLWESWSVISGNTNLEFICIDDTEDERLLVEDILINEGFSNVSVNTFCSFVPGGEYYSINGENRLDINNNGCNTNDNLIPNFSYSVTDGTIAGKFFSNGTGVYNLNVPEGTYTITPILENPDYFVASPDSFIVDFPTDVSPINQNFCITPNGEKDDLEIVILPLGQARPGFDTNYKVIYKNKGNTNISGTLELIYNENIDLMDFVLATPNIDSDIANVLTWSYSNLQPFETREILVTFNLNTPTETPPLNGGDSLGLVANIYPLTTDETPLDNNFQLKQIVVNSYDPNDKTCLQGETIEIDQVGKYVHYMIRFENTGTASAINVVVKDEIDLRKYDVSTLIPLHASHDFVTNIKDDNIVEFIFEDINLPFDDANNDGYVVFKIKTLETLVLGDIFANTAGIYFDYNAPIITNDEETTIGENLSVEETSIQDFVTLYPNPISNVLNINSKNTLEAISIYDVNGRQLKSISFTGNKLSTEINTSALSNGIYFVKIKTEVGIQTTKIIKN